MGLDNKTMKFMGTCLDEYLDIYEPCILDTDADLEEIEKCIKKIRKVAKKFKKGEGKKYLDPEMVEVYKDTLVSLANEKEIE